MKTLILSILITLTATICFAQKEITPGNAKYYVGKQVIVTGKIKEITESNSGNLFLNFEKSPPNTPLSIVIYSFDRADLQSKFLIKWDNLVNTTLTVTGTIETYENKPGIILKKTDQIVSID